MRPPPPPVVRRLLLAPAVAALSLAAVAVSPLALLAAFVFDLVLPGSWQTVRAVALAAAYAALEALALGALLLLWVATGFGLRTRAPRSIDAHYALLRWWLGVLYRAAGALFGLRIQVVEQPTPEPGPILVFARHAGPGNSLMLVGSLMIAYRRRPRIVALDGLQWDPVFDVFGHRLPNRFVRHDPSVRETQLRAIGELGSGLSDMDALVLFPEGHDFTWRLRLRAIAHLRRGGHLEAAGRAEELTNVLPPRPGGPTAAVLAAPGADVVFVAHTVLEDLGSLTDVWRILPLRHPIEAGYWRVPAAEVPRERDAIVDWLYAWWERIDDWIERRRPPPGGPGAAAES